MEVKEKNYDSLNSIFALWVAYKYKWVSYGKEVGSMTYFLRFKNDKNYAGNETEANRCFKILCQRLSLDYLEQGNPMEKVILYRNKNRGKSIKNLPNPEIFKIELNQGFMEKQAIIFSQNMVSEKEKIGWTNVCHYLEEYSKTQKKELETIIT